MNISSLFVFFAFFLFVAHADAQVSLTTSTLLTKGVIKRLGEIGRCTPSISKHSALIFSPNVSEVMYTHDFGRLNSALTFNIEKEIPEINFKLDIDVTHVLGKDKWQEVSISSLPSGLNSNIKSYLLYLYTAKGYEALGIKKTESPSVIRYLNFPENFHKVPSIYEEQVRSATEKQLEETTQRFIRIFNDQFDKSYGIGKAKRNPNELGADDYTFFVDQ